MSKIIKMDKKPRQIMSVPIAFNEKGEATNKATEYLASLQANNWLIVKRSVSVVMAPYKTPLGDPGLTPQLHVIYLLERK